MEEITVEKKFIRDLPRKLYKKLYDKYTLGPEYGLQGDLKHAWKTKSEKSYALLAYEGKSLIGWAGVFYMFHDDPRPWVEFFILPKFRGNGYATKLIEELPDVPYRFTAYSKTSYNIAKTLKRLRPKTDIYMWFEYNYLEKAKELLGIK